MTWVPLATGFILLPVYTNYLTPEDYGTRAIVLLAFVIFDVFSNFGVSWVIRAKYHKLGGIRHRYFFTLFCYICLLKTVILLLSLPFLDVYLTHFFSQWNVSYIYLIHLQLAVFFINSSVVLLTEIFVMEKNATTYSFVFIFAYIVNIIVATVSLVVFDKGISSIFYGEILQGLVFSLIGFIVLRKHFSIGFVSSVFSDLVRIGLPAMPKSAFSQIQHKIDQYIMQIFLPIGLLGIYSRSQFIKSGMDGMNRNFSRAFSPSYIESIIENKNTNFTRALVSKWVLFLGLVYIFFVLFLPDIFKVMGVNAAFNSMAIIAPTLAFRSVIMSISVMYNNNFLVSEKTYVFALRTFLAAFVGAGLNYILIPSYGVNGAILSAIVSAILVVSVSYIYSEVILNYRTALNYGIYAFVLMQILAVTAGVYMGLIDTLQIRLMTFVLSLLVGFFVFVNVDKGKEPVVSL